MSNVDVVNQFVETLLHAPDLTMQAVRLRLSMTDYELVLKKANVLKPFEKEWERTKELQARNEASLFPMQTAQKMYDDDFPDY